MSCELVWNFVAYSVQWERLCVCVCAGVGVLKLPNFQHYYCACFHNPYPFSWCNLRNWKMCACVLSFFLSVLCFPCRLAIIVSGTSQGVRLIVDNPIAAKFVYMCVNRISVRKYWAKQFSKDWICWKAKRMRDYMTTATTKNANAFASLHTLMVSSQYNPATQRQFYHLCWSSNIEMAMRQYYECHFKKNNRVDLKKHNWIRETIY